MKSNDTIVTAAAPSHNPQIDHKNVDHKTARFKLKVGPSPIHRWGVYACERIPKGSEIIEYTGEKIGRKQTKIRAEREFNYLFTLDSYWTIDGSVGGSGAEYINHCCEPNVEAEITDDWRIVYRALRDIHKGEEMTIDYRFGADVEKHPCACGAPNCRGMINLHKEKKAPRKKVAAGKKRSR